MRGSYFAIRDLHCTAAWLPMWSTAAVIRVRGVYQPSSLSIMLSPDPLSIWAISVYPGPPLSVWTGEWWIQICSSILSHKQLDSFKHKQCSHHTSPRHDLSRAAWLRDSDGDIVTRVKCGHVTGPGHGHAIVSSVTIQHRIPQSQVLEILALTSSSTSLHCFTRISEMKYLKHAF